MDRVSILNPTDVRSSAMRRANCRWSSSNSATVNLNRGDYVQHTGAWFPDGQYANFEIIRVN